MTKPLDRSIQRYYNPVRLIFGQDSFSQLTQQVGERSVLLVTSQGALERGLMDQLTAIRRNIVSVVSDIKSHPEFSDLKNTYQALNHSSFEVIVAIGGGSVLDGAKVFSVHGDGQSFSLVEKIIRTGKVESTYRTKPIISIPTTAGTGSEVTPWATVWDMTEKRKYSLHLPELFSEMAIYDPTLTVSVPMGVTIQTALDTLSHALESIWNRNASEITLDHAVRAIQLIVIYLPKLVSDLSNVDYRSQIMRACMYAGLSFSNTQTAIAHSMSYYITANKGIAHGIACSFTLPAIIDSIIGKHDFVDTALYQAFGECSSHVVRKMFAELAISTEFSDYGIGPVEFKQLLDSLTTTNRMGNSLLDAQDFRA